MLRDVSRPVWFNKGKAPLQFANQSVLTAIALRSGKQRYAMCQLASRVSAAIAGSNRRSSASLRKLFGLADLDARGAIPATPRSPHGSRSLAPSPGGGGPGPPPPKESPPFAPPQDIGQKMCNCRIACVIPPSPRASNFGPCIAPLPNPLHRADRISGLVAHAFERCFGKLRRSGRAVIRTSRARANPVPNQGRAEPVRQATINHVPSGIGPRGEAASCDARPPPCRTPNRAVHLHHGGQRFEDGAFERVSRLPSN